jgi:hypothetical protein
MATEDYVIVILENKAGQKFFDRILYIPQEEKGMIDRRLDLMDMFGFKARSIKMPVGGFDLNCKWDIFLAYALAYGIGCDLAYLGRECVRRAHEHNWDPELKTRYHLAEDGRAMIQFAMNEPEKAREIWSALIRAEGEVTAEKNDLSCEDVFLQNPASLRGEEFKDEGDGKAAD